MNQKTVSKMIFTAAAVLSLMACTKEKRIDALDPNSTLNPEGLVELRLTSSSGTQMPEGETVHVWVDDFKTYERLYRNNTMTSGSGGALTGSPMYFPATGHPADIYAIHGNFGEIDYMYFWGVEQTHIVVQDQRTGSSGYALSDLAFAKSVNVAPEGNPTTVPLTFNRLISKVEVVLVAGSGSSTVSKVEIINTLLESKLTPSKTDDFIAIASGPTGENPIEIGTGMTSADDAGSLDDSKKTINQAIIVPQTLEKGTNFIRITTNEGTEQIYQLPNATTFEPGKTHRFTVTVTNPFGDKTASAAAVGDYYLADGSVLSQESTLTPELASKVIGIVFYAGHHEKDNSDYSDTGIGQTKCHGYAVALTDVNNDTDDRLAWEAGPNQEYNKLVGTTTDKTDWNGYPNQQKFHEYVNDNPGWKMTHFPAAFACETYGNRMFDQDGNSTTAYDWQKPLAAPENSSGWFLPTFAQLKYLFDNPSPMSDNMINVKNNLPDDCDYKDHILWLDSGIYNPDSPKSDLYWTSTEFDKDEAGMIWPENHLGGGFKNAGMSARAVLAF